MIRHDIVPLTLYSIQSERPISLIPNNSPVGLRNGKFDVLLNQSDGLVHPTLGNTYVGPNGLSLKMRGEELEKEVASRSGDFRVVCVLVGQQLPEDLIIVHELPRSFSLQVRKPMTLEKFNVRLTEFLLSLPFETKKVFLEHMQDPDDFDM